ncbi:hypothetical protein Q7C36_011271 [Tachysurus vachellii]|uniref:Uncharacterized protein n=1 Tax=Tachysurus vachellii TaxID=175792 RepID=A0AA88MQ28_TACVA|nr:hypothetical protein Q7C36_011271 [Tachysurus vachellii]
MIDDGEPSGFPNARNSRRAGGPGRSIRASRLPNCGIEIQIKSGPVQAKAAAVYGLRLPESINFYDMSESSSHVPHSRGRVIAVRQQRGGLSSVTPVINLQRGTAAFTSAA